MKKTFVTSDWHCGETRFEIMGRPFKTPQEQVDTLIKNHNELVSPEDDVIVVGDVCYQKTPEWLPYISKFNGNKILIRGNHDRVFTDEQLKPYFSEIIPEGEGIIRQIEDKSDNSRINVYITHYPSRGLPNVFNLCGHIHGAFKYQLNMMNIGVDVHHFRPVNMDTIPKHLKAITDYYDEDVWVAYHKINSDYVGLRGKKGSYFSPTK